MRMKSRWATTLAKVSRLPDRSMTRDEVKNLLFAASYDHKRFVVDPTNPDSLRQAYGGGEISAPKVIK